MSPSARLKTKISLLFILLILLVVAVFAASVNSNEASIEQSTSLIVQEAKSGKFVDSNFNELEAFFV